MNPNQEEQWRRENTTNIVGLPTSEKWEIDLSQTPTKLN